MTIWEIAHVCHDANRAYCRSIGDDSQKPWEEAEGWQRASAVSGVEFRLKNHGVTPEGMHEAWAKDKIANGWKYGPVKDADKKEHPCLVNYRDLPLDQRMKDVLFGAIVDALASGGLVL